MDSLGYYHLALSVIVIYDKGPPTVWVHGRVIYHCHYFYLTYSKKCICLSDSEGLVKFMSSQSPSMVLNDKSRAHIVKVEALHHPYGCPCRLTAALFHAALHIQHHTPSRALVSISSKQPAAPQRLSIPPFTSFLPDTVQWTTLSPQAMDRIEVS